MFYLIWFVCAVVIAAILGLLIFWPEIFAWVFGVIIVIGCSALIAAWINDNR